MKIFAIISLFLLLIIFGKGHDLLQTEKKIRVINNSAHYFSNVMLFSMKFDDLKPNDTSAYKSLNYKPLQDDPLIYCSIGDENYARYLEIPSKEDFHVSFVIDSVRNGIIYLSSKYDIIKR